MTTQDKIIQLWQAANEIGIAVNALKELQLPGYLPTSDQSEFTKAKKDTFLKWFVLALDEGILAAINAIKKTYNLGVRDVQTLLSDSDSLLTNIGEFTNCLNQLKSIESALEEYLRQMLQGDQQVIAELTSKLNQIQDKINELSDNIDDGSYKIGSDIVITYINVGINVASEENPVVPVVEGVVKVGETVAQEVKMTKEILALNDELFDIWQSMSEQSQKVATLQLALRQFARVTSFQDLTSPLTTITNIWSDFRDDIDNQNWSKVGDFVNRFDKVTTARSAETLSA